jgi:hypothetical protein
MSDTQIDTPVIEQVAEVASVAEVVATPSAESVSTDATKSVAEAVAAPVEATAEAAGTAQTEVRAAEPAAAGVAIELAPVVATNELSEQQKKAVASLLEKTAELAKSLVQDGSLGPLGVTKLIGSLMKNAEGLQVDGTALKGSDKKKVVLEVGKQIINTYVTGEHKATVASLYDGLAEPTLEAMIDMSRGVNFATAAMHIINDKEAQVAVVNAAKGCFSVCFK